MGMGPEDDHVVNKKGVGSKENSESIRSDPNMGNWRIGQNTNGNRWKNAENIRNNGKHRKRRNWTWCKHYNGKGRKTSENNRKHRKRRNWNWWKYGTWHQPAESNTSTCQWAAARTKKNTRKRSKREMPRVSESMIDWCQWFVVVKPSTGNLSENEIKW